LLVIVAGLLATAGCIGTPPPPPPPPAGPAAPAYSGDFPDPFVLTGDNPAYRAFSTNVELIAIPTISATQLDGWSPAPQPGNYPYDDALARLPQWSGQNPPIGLVWAPSVHKFGNTYVMYYVAPHAASGDQCIGVATSSTPEGKYTPLQSGPLVDASPIICQTSIGGSIDPSVFIDTTDGNRPWLVWKNDGNCCGAPVQIWSQPLASDGLHVQSNNSPTALITVDQGWESGGSPFNTVVEGPSMTLSGGSWYLFYSANDFDSADYAIGYARCSAPSGSCTKPQSSPIMATGPNGAGPGGAEFFLDVGGGLQIAYHAWASDCVGVEAGCSRLLRFSSVAFPNGVPGFG